jgi:transaldolase
MKDGDLDADMELSLFANDLNRNCRIICGSIRKPEDLQDCWLNGADIVTASLSIIKQVIAHPQTDKAVKQFQEDIDSWLK